jgi:hypothetical protein
MAKIITFIYFFHLGKSKRKDANGRALISDEGQLEEFG